MDLTSFHLQKAKNLLSTPTRKRLLENFLSLSALQGANYLLPLITLPYLVRVLGPEKYGLIAFAQAFIQYFNILTDYGFNLSATREISIHRESREKLSEIFSSVMTVKLGLLALSFFIMSAIVFSFEKFRNDWLIYYLTFGTVVGQALFPIWFFQGVERMKYITFLNITAKLIFTISIFIFIHKSSDYIYVPLINSLGFMVAGVLALRIVSKDFGVKFKLPSLYNIKHQLKEGWHIFISNITGNIYGQGTVLILGLVSNNTIVGYYSASERLVKAIASISQPLAQTIYPFIVRKSNNCLKIYFKKLFYLSFISSLLIAVILFLASTNIIISLYGEKMFPSVRVFELLIIGMIFTILNVIKQPFIFAIRKDKANSYMYAFTGISFIPVCFFLSIFFKEIGTALSFIYVEILIFTIGMYILKPIWRYK